jgi:hypothetical protein
VPVLPSAAASEPECESPSALECGWASAPEAGLASVSPSGMGSGFAWRSHPGEGSGWAPAELLALASGSRSAAPMWASESRSAVPVWASELQSAVPASRSGLPLESVLASPGAGSGFA